MNRLLQGALSAMALTVILSACDDGLSGYVTTTASCSAYLSCDTCTPVVGCGWCTGPGGAGVCASDPDYCPTQEFSWTWDMSGCSVAADASVVTAEAGSSEGSAQDSAPRSDAARTSSDASGN